MNKPSLSDRLIRQIASLTPYHLDYALEDPGDGRRLKLYVEHRDGRLPLRSSQLEMVRDEVGEAVGAILHLVSDDGRQECLGSVSAPLPLTFAQEMQSAEGALLIFASDDQAMPLGVTGAVVLHHEDIQPTSRHQRARP